MQQAETVERPAITPLKAPLGAEIKNVDLSRLQDPKQIRVFRDALDVYGVLCFRDQNFTEQPGSSVARLLS